MKLYYTPGACSLSPHIVLLEAGLPFELEAVDLATKETEKGEDYYLINTKGAVPALQLDDGQVLTEGAVIIQYLADQVPEKGLIPAVGSMARYRVLEWLNFTAMDFQKNFLPVFRPDFAACRAAAVKLLERQCDYIDRQLVGKDWLIGETFTIADIYLYVITLWLSFAEIDISQWKLLSQWQKRVAARPMVQKALADEGLQ
ncbi:MAG: glutathione transferase GstA [Oxalobacter sp.]|nr:glutathione transferase GstA [Oxalobacter sp.]